MGPWAGAAAEEGSSPGAAAEVGSSSGEAQGRPGWEKSPAPRSTLPLPGSVV